MTKLQIIVKETFSIETLEWLHNLLQILKADFLKAIQYKFLKLVNFHTPNKELRQ